ncbi:MAG: hypothetical protein VKO21_01835 [Candidatus Sericytochromatia bacterium]|nr:hypothetical protein [Candidatus Sericytochromatia bacterium]
MVRAREAPGRLHPLPLQLHRHTGQGVVVGVDACRQPILNHLDLPGGQALGQVRAQRYADKSRRL